jgi:uncharacterized protein (DUF1778 family)
MAPDHEERRNRSGSENRQRQGRVSARVTADEGQRIYEAAERHGEPVAQFLRRVILAATEQP